MSSYVAKRQMASDLSEGLDNLLKIIFICFYQISIYEHFEVFLSLTIFLPVH